MGELASVYTAFVSYSHQDSSTVRPFHRQLENFRIPIRIARKYATQKTLRPIFLDRLEYRSAGNYRFETEHTLRNSKALIVICTPNSARSSFVNEEIILFKKAGLEARIFAIIFDGEPNATAAGKPDDECFPPALRFALGADGLLTADHVNPIAADARSTGDGRRDAVLKIVAGLLHVPFDEFKRRHRQVEQWRRARLGFVALVVVAMASLGVMAMSTMERRTGSLRAAQVAASNGLFDQAGLLGLQSIAPSGSIINWSPDGIDLALLEAGIRARASAKGGGCAPEEVAPEQPCFAGRVELSADKRVLAAKITPQVIQVASTETGAPLREIVIPGTEIVSVALSNDGGIIALGESDGTLTLIDVASGEQLAVGKLAAGINSLRFRQTDLLLVIRSDYVVALVRQIGATLVVDSAAALPSTTIAAVADPSGRWVLARLPDGASLLGEIGTGAPPVLRRIPLARRFYDWDFSPDGELLLIATNDQLGNRFYVFRTATAEQLDVVSGRHTAIEVVAFSDDGGRLLTGGVDRKIRVWNVGDGEPTALLELPFTKLGWAGFSASGSIVVAHDGEETGIPQLYAWRPAEPSRRLALRGHVGPIRQAFFTEPGTLLTVADDASIRTWDVGDAFEQLIQLKNDPRAALVEICGTEGGPFASYVQNTEVDPRLCSTGVLAWLGSLIKLRP